MHPPALGLPSPGDRIVEMIRAKDDAMIQEDFHRYDEAKWCWTSYWDGDSLGYRVYIYIYIYRSIYKSHW